MNRRYVIAVDYYMYNSATDEEYTKKMYLYRKGEHRIWIFRETPDETDDPEVEVVEFNDPRDAHAYFAIQGLSGEHCSFENARIERVG